MQRVTDITNARFYWATARAKLLALAASAALVMASGCDGLGDFEFEEENNETYDTYPPVCAADSECPGDQICRYNLCTIPDPVETRLFGFTFLPDSRSGLQPQETSPFEVDGTQRLDFVLDPSVEVTGTVQFAESDLSVETGTLIFDKRQTDNEIFRQQAPLERGQFALELLPGVYDVTFISQDENVPNRRWLGKTIEARTALPLTLPPRDTLVTIQGTLTHRDTSLGLAPATINQPVHNAKVRAIAADGTTSTVALSSDDGTFSLRVWGDQTNQDLWIGPASPNELIPQTLIKGAIDTSSGSVQALALSLGEWNPTPLQLRLDVLQRISEMAEIDFSMNDARITLRAQAGDGKITLSKKLGDDTPLFILPLLYTVEIRPPAESKFGEITLELDARLDGAPSLEIATLPLKHRLFGTITDSEDQPIANAQLEFNQLQDAADELSSTLRPVTVSTDADGNYEAWLEPDWDYTLEVKPPKTSGAPIGVYTIGPSEDEERELLIALPEPMVISGSVFVLMNDDLKAQPDLSVELYEYLGSDRHVIATSRTDSEGNFSVVVGATTTTPE